MSSTTDPTSTPGVEVPALRKGLKVLELLASRGPLTMAEIQQHGQLNKSMTFRLLRALGEHGYVDHDVSSHRYSLALKLLELGGAVTARLDLVSVSQPLLSDLRNAFQETINLGVLREDHILYVAIAESSRPGLLMSGYVGNRNHLHSTAMGKVMLAFLPAEQQQEILAHYPLPRFTPHTITDPALLRDAFARAHQQGYAVDNEENEIGARCIAVPILNTRGLPLAGLSVSGPISRIDGEAVRTMAEHLWRVSDKIAHRLGHTPTRSGGNDPGSSGGRQEAVTQPSSALS